MDTVSHGFYFIIPNKKCRQCKLYIPGGVTASASTPTPYSPPLEHHQLLGFQVRHVQFSALLFDSRVFAHKQPTHVREEEAKAGIVRVGVCF